MEEQHWDERQARFQVDIERVVGPTKDAVMAMIRSRGSNCQGKETLVKTLQLLSDLASMARDESSPAKRARSAVLVEWIDLTLGLMAVCNDEGDFVKDVDSVKVFHEIAKFSFHFVVVEIIEAIMQLYLSAFDSLLQQMGTSQAEKIIRSLLEIYSQQNIELALKQENPHGIKAIEQYFNSFSY